MATKKKPMATKKKKNPKRPRPRPRARSTTRQTKSVAARAQTPRRTPESLRLRSLAATLTVKDLTRSMAWYRDVLGFTPADRWEQDGKLRGVQMRAGICDVTLNQDDFAKGRDRNKGEGFRLWVSTVQSIDAIAARARANGATLDREPRRTEWGAYAFAITDPDGFKITFVQET
jgi:catechol 2,3-dioxygenase-like lactoylglutathione lyase family enzyme